MDLLPFFIFGFSAITHYLRTLSKNHFQMDFYIPCKIGLMKSVVDT